ncbi:MAG: hypothetical protein JXQ87_17305 [Bacteroidia bacterium]
MKNLTLAIILVCYTLNLMGQKNCGILTCEDDAECALMHGGFEPSLVSKDEIASTNNTPDLTFVENPNPRLNNGEYTIKHFENFSSSPRSLPFQLEGSGQSSSNDNYMMIQPKTTMGPVVLWEQKLCVPDFHTFNFTAEVASTIRDASITEKPRVVLR